MHNLLNFFVKYFSILLFIILELFCFYLIFTHNSYQRSVYLNTSNLIVGNLYETTSEINSYFGLKYENEKLLEANGTLQNKIALLENRLFETTKDTISISPSVNNNITNEYIIARVIKNSINLNHNLITINKGVNDSVTIGMAVISVDGAVGEVVEVSSNFAIIQPLINTKSNYSCKLKNSNAFGPFHWDGLNSKFVTMNDFPSYEPIQVGDTIVTSGYSDVFPSDILIGTVKEIQLDEQANNYDLQIELSTNFNTLNNVLIVKRDYLKELNQLEKTVNQ